MRSVSQANISDAFKTSCADTTDPRVRLVLSHPDDHLHAFAKVVGLTHQEW